MDARNFWPPLVDGSQFARQNFRCVLVTFAVVSGVAHSATRHDALVNSTWQVNLPPPNPLDDDP